MTKLPLLFLWAAGWWSALTAQTPQLTKSYASRQNYNKVVISTTKAAVISGYRVQTIDREQNLTRGFRALHTTDTKTVLLTANFKKEGAKTIITFTFSNNSGQSQLPLTEEAGTLDSTLNVTLTDLERIGE